MYRDKKVALVIPAYNEERLITPTLEAVPKTVDRVYVVDDVSTDNMPQVVRDFSEKDNRVQLISHEKNQGPGGGIITGYKAALQDGYDLAVVVGGDNQMPLDEIEKFLDPLIDGKADYTKGNRFMEEGNAFSDMPRIRLLGNTIISLLTKISSGFYSIFDVVDGYTAITKEAIEKVNWDKAWKGYGYPMDFLMRLNLKSLRVLDIPRRAIYLEGERQSQIKGLHYALRVSPMLMRNFFHRLHDKYLFSNFHPLVFLYYIGLIFILLGLYVGFEILMAKLQGVRPTGATAVLCALFTNIGIQSMFFAILFDMFEERNLLGRK